MKDFKQKPEFTRYGFSHLGFGLVEVMVSMAILGVVGLAVISQQKLSTKSTLEISSEAEINNIFRRVISEISDEAVCSTTNNFKGKSPTNTLQSALYTSTGTIFLQENVNYGQTGTGANTTSQGQVRVTDIQTTANGANEMILKITFKKKAEGLLQFSTGSVTKEIPLNVILDASGNITSCFGNFDQIAKTLWKSPAVGTWPSIKHQQRQIPMELVLMKT